MSRRLCVFLVACLCVYAIFVTLAAVGASRVEAVEMDINRIRVLRDVSGHAFNMKQSSYRRWCEATAAASADARANLVAASWWTCLREWSAVEFFARREMMREFCISVPKDDRR